MDGGALSAFAQVDLARHFQETKGARVPHCLNVGAPWRSSPPWPDLRFFSFPPLP